MNERQSITYLIPCQLVSTASMILTRVLLEISRRAMDNSFSEDQINV